MTGTVTVREMVTRKHPVAEPARGPRQIANIRNVSCMVPVPGKGCGVFDAACLPRVLCWSGELRHLVSTVTHRLTFVYIDASDYRIASYYTRRVTTHEDEWQEM
jgi:hypothetical protein